MSDTHVTTKELVDVFAHSIAQGCMLADLDRLAAALDAAPRTPFLAALRPPVDLRRRWDGDRPRSHQIHSTRRIVQQE